MSPGSPAPLVHVEDWARARAVEEIFSVRPEFLNDDRIGRAPDAVAPELDGIVGSVGARAIAEFGVEVSRIHWDMTSTSLFGAYASPDHDCIEPRFGHPKDRRPDLLQVQAGLAVSADGGIPLWHRAYDGDAGKPPAQRGSYRVAEDTMVLAGKKADPDLELRRVFVWSSARAGAAAKARSKKLDRARGDLERLGRGLGGRYYPTEKEVTERIAVITRERRVKDCLRTTASSDPVTAKPTLEWHFDEAALAAEAAAGGWYALLANLAPEVSAAGVLRSYKGQETAERRYSNFKGPIAAAPMFLKNNRRIEALISVICLALLIFSLVERAVRLAISPAVKLAGLWAGQAAKPTGRLIFTALSRLRLVPASATGPAQIPRPPPLQARLLELLGVDPRRPR